MTTADPLCPLSLDVLVLGVHRGLLCYAGGFQESMLLASTNNQRLENSLNAQV